MVLVFMVFMILLVWKWISVCFVVVCIVGMSWCVLSSVLLVFMVFMILLVWKWISVCFVVVCIVELS